MKFNKAIFVLFILPICNCKKDSIPQSSSLTIVNAVVGSAPLATNFSGTDQISYSNVQRLNYGSYSPNTNWFGSYSGAVRLGLFQYPNDTIAHGTPLFNLTLNLPANTIHSLYLTGTVSAPDTVFTTDILPRHLDSTVGIRFVNLSPGSSPVNVTLSTSTTTNEVSNIAYKKVTDFKNYAVISSVSSYVFQFRNAATNAIITTQTLSGINNGTGTNSSTNQYRFRNITILLIGQPGGTGAATQKALVINNY